MKVVLQVIMYFLISFPCYSKWEKVHEDKVFSGFGGEVAAYISENLFEYLDAPVKRVGSTFTPVGFNRILEKEVLPNSGKIKSKAIEVLDF